MLISSDTDFGTLLALRRAREPSLVIFRRSMGRRSARQLEFLLANLSAVEADLVDGAVNGPWRITFEWQDGDAHEVDLEQYH